MYMTPEPFLSAEIAYRQERVAEEFTKHPRRRRHRVPRSWRQARIPEQRRGSTLVA